METILVKVVDTVVAGKQVLMLILLKEKFFLIKIDTLPEALSSVSYM